MEIMFRLKEDEKERGWSGDKAGVGDGGKKPFMFGTLNEHHPDSNILVMSYSSPHPHFHWLCGIGSNNWSKQCNSMCSSFFSSS